MTLAAEPNPTAAQSAEAEEEDAIQSQCPEYSEEALPLTHYARILALYNLAFALFLVVSKQSGKPIPERIEWRDVLLLGVATFKLSRLISKEVVTTPLRAPFTTFVERTGQGEVKEQPRGEGTVRAVGELLSCPFCLGAWVAATLAYGLVLSPPVTRFAATILTTLCLSDFLQLGYTAACEGANLATQARRRGEAELEAA
jgi:hypothetical protein